MGFFDPRRRRQSTRPISLDSIPTLQGSSESTDKLSKPTWTTPAPGYVKLNVDAAWINNRKASGGAVIRREDGSWVIGKSFKLFAKSIAEAEVVALRQGLLLGRKMMITKMEVETDALEVQELLIDEENNLNHEFGVVIVDVATLLAQDWKCIIKHVGMEANKLAHEVARIVMKMHTKVKYHHLRPPSVDVVYDRDLEALAAHEDNEM